MADELLENAEFGKKKKEEDPILIAQRYLNIFRQMHIFNQAKRDQFDNMLLQLPTEIRILLSTLPGGIVLINYIEELEQKRGLASKPVPYVKPGAESKNKSETPTAAKPSDGAIVENASVVIGASFASELSSSISLALQETERRYKEDIKALTENITRSLTQSQNAIANMMKEMYLASHRKEILYEKENPVAEAVPLQNKPTKNQDILSAQETNKPTTFQTLTKEVEEAFEPVAEPEPEVSDILDEPIPEVLEPAAEPVAETFEPLAEPEPEISDIIDEPAPEVLEPAAEPVAETFEPVAEPEPELSDIIDESAPEVLEPAAEPVAETFEPVAEPEPELSDIIDEPAPEVLEPAAETPYVDEMAQIRNALQDVYDESAPQISEENEPVQENENYSETYLTDDSQENTSQNDTDPMLQNALDAIFSDDTTEDFNQGSIFDDTQSSDIASTDIFDDSFPEMSHPEDILNEPQTTDINAAETPYENIQDPIQNEEYPADVYDSQNFSDFDHNQAFQATTDANDFVPDSQAISDTTDFQNSESQDSTEPELQNAINAIFSDDEPQTQPTSQNPEPKKQSYLDELFEKAISSQQNNISEPVSLDDFANTPVSLDDFADTPVSLDDTTPSYPPADNSAYAPAQSHETWGYTNQQTTNNDDEWEWEYVEDDGSGAGADEGDWEWEYVEDENPQSK